MAKIKKISIAVILAAMLILFVSIGTVAPAFADCENEVQSTVLETVNPNISRNKSDFEQIAEQFTEYLKDKYGADYELYYNQIIERWGSVEAYLLSLGDKLPEEYQSGWDKFIGWLGEYSVLWAPALAVLIVILVAVIGKKKFDKLLERIVNAKLSPIVHELNLQSNATVAVIHAQEALLGNNERFADQVKELETAEKELKNE